VKQKKKLIIIKEMELDLVVEISKKQHMDLFGNLNKLK
jgi:hypothetical protein